MSDEGRFEKLLNDYLEGELNGQKMVELQEFLKHEERLRTGADSYQIHRQLGFLSRDGKAERERFVSDTMERLPSDSADFVAEVVGEVENFEEGGRKRAVRFPTLLKVAAAIALLAVVATVLIWKSGEGKVVRVKEMNGSIRWIANDGEEKGALEIGMELGGGMVESHSANSWVELVFSDGTEVALTGRSLMKFTDEDSQKLLHLFRGNVSADVVAQPEGKPLRLGTPTAEVEVLGTQFNVTTDAYSTRVAVNEGKVRVTRLSDESTEVVKSDQLIVAALENRVRFKAIPRDRPTDTWRSALPQDELFGKWQGASGGGLRAMPLLWREGVEKPVLLFVCALIVSGDDAPPVILKKDARFRVHGKLVPNRERQEQGDVVFGFTTHHAKGGFAGKYLTGAKLGESLGEDGGFEIDLKLADFVRQKGCFPASSAGHELFEWFSLTVREDLGLEIVGVELLSE